MSESIGMVVSAIPFTHTHYRVLIPIESIIYKWVANRVLIAMETTKVGMCKRCSSAFEYTGEMPDECGDCNTVYFD